MKGRQGLYVALQSLKPGRDPPRNGTRNIANSGVHGLLNNFNDNWYKSHPYLWDFAGEISTTTTKWHKWTQCSLHDTGPLCSIGWVPVNVRAHMPHKLLCEKRQDSNRQEAIMQTSIRSETKQRGWEQKKGRYRCTQRAWLNGGGRGLSLRVTPAAHLSRHSLAVELFLHHVRERARSLSLFVSLVSLALSRWA